MVIFGKYFQRVGRISQHNQPVNTTLSIHPAIHPMYEEAGQTVTGSRKEDSQFKIHRMK